LGRGVENNRYWFLEGSFPFQGEGGGASLLARETFFERKLNACNFFDHDWYGKHLRFQTNSKVCQFSVDDLEGKVCPFFFNPMTGCVIFLFMIGHRKQKQFCFNLKLQLFQFSVERMLTIWSSMCRHVIFL
jgi:hypothetical protein